MRRPQTLTCLFALSALPAGWLPGVAPPARGDARPHNTGPPAAIRSLASRPGGTLFVLAADRDLLGFDALSNAAPEPIVGPEAAGGVITAVAFSPSGDRLAYAAGLPGRAGEVRILAFPGRQVLSVVRPHTDAVYSVSFSPDGSRLASAAGDRTVKVWDVASGSRRYTLSDSTAELYSVAYRPDGKQLAAGGADKMIRVWDVGPDAGRLEQSSFAHDGPVLRLAYTPDSASLVSAGEDRAVKVWDSVTLTERVELPRQPDWPLSLALCATRPEVAVGRADGTLGLYRLEDGRLIRTLLPLAASPAPPGPTNLRSRRGKAR